jgi:hypothetical protein
VPGPAYDGPGIDGPDGFGFDEGPDGRGSASFGLSTSVRSALSGSGPLYDGLDGSGPGYDDLGKYEPEVITSGFGGSVVSGPNLGGSGGFRSSGFEDNDRFESLSGDADAFTSSSTSRLVASGSLGGRSSSGYYDIGYGPSDDVYPIPSLGSSSSTTRISRGLPSLPSAGGSGSTYFTSTYTRGPSFTFGPRITSRRFVTYPARRVRFGGSSFLPLYDGVIGGAGRAFSVQSTGGAIGDSLQTLKRDYQNYIKKI